SEIMSFKNNQDKFLTDTLSVTFEDLKKDFNVQVRKIAKYLDFSVTLEEIKQLQENTSLKKLKSSATEGKMSQYSKDNDKATKLFRKGKIGESEDFFTPNQKKDLENIMKGKTGFVYKLYYKVFFEWRRSFYKM